MTDFQHTFSRLDAYIQERMRVDNTPGLALAITDREQTLHVATAGYADLAAKASVTPETLFQIGSIGKSFTAIAILQLVEAGRIDLHAPVSDYLPWFNVPSDQAPITVHHLLSHTAGITAGIDFAAGSRFEVYALRHALTACPPGANFHYSNVGYKALGFLLEEVLNQDYGQIIQERILDPLDMRATAPVLTHAIRPRVAVGYQPLHDDQPPYRGDPLVTATWVETNTGDGSIAATPADMAAYIKMLLNRGRGPRGAILSDAGFALMTQQVVQESAGSVSTFYGYGLYTLVIDDHVFIDHTGGMVGYVAHLILDPADGLGAVVMMNGPGRPYRIARTALQLVQAAVHGEELPSPMVEDPCAVEAAAEYAGVYTSDARSFELVAEGDRLVLLHDGGRIVLERYGSDSFYVNHPDFARFLLRFDRDDAERVIAVTHGGDWRVNDRYAGPTTFDYPSDWLAYLGHYRSDNPWATNFRIVMRQGRLWLIFPVEPDGFDDEQPLVPLADGGFQVGEGPCQPKRIHFDTVVDVEAWRANLSGGDYFRFFTP